MCSVQEFTLNFHVHLNRTFSFLAKLFSLIESLVVLILTGYSALIVTGYSVIILTGYSVLIVTGYSVIILTGYSAIILTGYSIDYYFILGLVTNFIYLFIFILFYFFAFCDLYSLMLRVCLRK